MVRIARAVLFTLVLIHFVLPFTPVNSHPEPIILIGSSVLGFAFLAVAVKSMRSPKAFLSVGLGLLLVVYVVSAITGASPLAEGFLVKVVFAVLLVLGIISAKKTER
jgi:hypothetical protein